VGPLRDVTKRGRNDAAVIHLSAVMLSGKILGHIAGLPLACLDCAMAFTFRYRFVDFGTVFAPGAGIRAADQGSENPCALFVNELVTDVGGTCLNGGEELAVLDHHFRRDAQFPAASAAVLHKAKLIRNRFAQQDGVFWLVTHKQPDFDAFCSMYLARWILEDPNAIVEWQDCGLHPDGWADSVDRRKIKWFAPDLHEVSSERRWPLLMASYASIVDNGQHFPCPRSRALHSILYAALARGRDYLCETSGATELFDEIKAAIRDKKRNPIFDSVLEGSREFAPELEMLDREVEAYHRDLRRARKSIVYLQRSEEPFPIFFDKLKQRPLLPQPGARTIDPEHLLTDQPRVPTDGIYLRDPECLLFKEWARLDLENSALGRGFEFTAVAYPNGRPEGDRNHTDYFFAIDPERADGRHLYRVWARLQAKEVAALGEQQVSEKPARRGFEARAGTLAKYFSDPWFDGQNYLATIVATPNHGTEIAPPGSDGGLEDDAIVEVVRSEVEHSVYLSKTGSDIPVITVCDLSAVRDESDAAPLDYDIAELAKVPPPTQRRFRFARIPLRNDVPIAMASGNHLSQQIGETLWEALYPDLRLAKPLDFAQRHLVVAPGCVGVWGDRGIGIAYKPDQRVAAQPQGVPDCDNAVEKDFIRIVALARQIDELIAKSENLSTNGREAPSHPPELNDSGSSNLPRQIAAEGELLARTAARIKHNLTLPHSDLLRRFYDATGIDELLTTLRDLNQTAAEHLRREQMDEQASKTRESTETVAEVQTKLEYLEVFIVGVYALEMFEAFTRFISGGDLREGFIIMVGSFLFLAFTAWKLVPWKRKPGQRPVLEEKPFSVLLLALILWVAAIGWLIVRAFWHK
jgi:hypothetical protein